MYFFFAFSGYAKCYIIFAYHTYTLLELCSHFFTPFRHMNDGISLNTAYKRIHMYITFYNIRIQSISGNKNNNNHNILCVCECVSNPLFYPKRSGIENVLFFTFDLNLIVPEYLHTMVRYVLGRRNDDDMILLTQFMIK